MILSFSERGDDLEEDVRRIVFEIETIAFDQWGVEMDKLVTGPLKNIDDRPKGRIPQISDGLRLDILEIQRSNFA